MFTTFGDHRIHRFVLKQRWAALQHDLVAGRTSWDLATMDEERRSARDEVVDRIKRMRLDLVVAGDTASVSADVPAASPILDKFVRQEKLLTIPGLILDLIKIDSPVSVPVYRAHLLGRTFDDAHDEPDGLRRNAYVVGRPDVRHVSRFHEPGDVVGTILGHVRDTRRKAFATARRVQAALERWDRYRIVRRARVTAACKTRRDLRETRVDEDDDGITSFRP